MSATPDDCAHLSIDTVREIHAEAIKRFGGLNGVRDANLLASAVLTPQSSLPANLLMPIYWKSQLLICSTSATIIHFLMGINEPR